MLVVWSLSGLKRTKRGRVIIDEFSLREIYFLYGGRQVTDVEYGRPSGSHDEGRLFHRVVADRDDQIGTINRSMQIVAFRAVPM